jgi:hypothetical protein
MDAARVLADARDALRAALKMMQDTVSDADGRDRVGLGCGNCVAGVPMAHSLGCRMETAARQLDALAAETKEAS